MWIRYLSTNVEIILWGEEFGLLFSSEALIFSSSPHSSFSPFFCNESVFLMMVGFRHKYADSILNQLAN
jgi:hypothetical protein